MYLKKNSVDFMLALWKCYWIIQTIWWFVVTYLFISYKDVVVNSQIFLCNFSHYQTYSIRINGYNPERNVLTTLCMEYESAGCTAEPGVNELSLCWSYMSLRLPLVILEKIKCDYTAPISIVSKHKEDQPMILKLSLISHFIKCLWFLAYCMNIYNWNKLKIHKPNSIFHRDYSFPEYTASLK